MKRFLLGESLSTAEKPVGLITGVYLSKKYPVVKRLQCKLMCGDEVCLPFRPQNEDAPYHLSSVRTCLPNGYPKLTRGMPIYDEKGSLLGILSGVEVDGDKVTALYTQTGKRFASTCLKSVCDAVILRKKPVYPIGESVPVPFQNEYLPPFINKSVLKKAVQKGQLIRLTLSLPPFEFFDAF